MFKKSILTLSLAAVLSVSIAGVVDAYIGNLRDTRDEAINAGYVPCKRCNP